MEDFDYQYIQQIGKQKQTVPNIQELLETTCKSTSNAFLKQAVELFKHISGHDLNLSLIENWKPFSRAFLGVTKSNNQQIPLQMLGSGYEMIFSLLMAFQLSKQSNKQLICILDEPELHLHPSLQQEFVKVLPDFSRLHKSSCQPTPHCL